MKILETIDNYLNEGKKKVYVLIKTPKDIKDKVMRTLDDEGFDPGDEGTYEVSFEAKSRKEAKKVLDKLPPIRFTISEGKMQKGYWVSLHGRAGELDSAFVKDKKGIKSVLIDWASTLSDGDTIKIKKGESER